MVTRPRSCLTCVREIQEFRTSVRRGAGIPAYRTLQYVPYRTAPRRKRKNHVLQNFAKSIPYISSARWNSSVPYVTVPYRTAPRRAHRYSIRVTLEPSVPYANRTVRQGGKGCVISPRYYIDDQRNDVPLYPPKEAPWEGPPAPPPRDWCDSTSYRHE